MDVPFKEAWLLKLASRQNPTEPVLNAIADRLAKEHGEMPPMTGLCLPGRPNIVFINSARLLDDIYVKQNAYATKNELERTILYALGERNVFVMDTFHKDYPNTRKVLTAAFFKNKLGSITQIIKEEVVEVIRECEAKGEHEVDIVEFWT